MFYLFVLNLMAFTYFGYRLCHLCFCRASTRQSYQNLIATAKECFKELLIELKECTTISTSQTDRDRARHILALHDQLDYSQSSFMNLFNYQYGHLAPHRDRCLVTIVFTLPPHAQPPSRRDDACATPPRHSTIKNSSYKNLWCLAPQQEENSSDIHSWTSIDALVAKPGSQHSVCLHVGEELRTLYNGQIPAALHCVQADPTTSATTTAPVTTEQQQKGKEKVVQHEQRLMLATNNRLSAALILSSAEISAIVEEVLSETKPL